MRLTHVYLNCEWTWIWLSDKVAAGLRHISGAVNDCIRKWTGELPDLPTRPHHVVLPPTSQPPSSGAGVAIPPYIYFGPDTGGPSISDVGFVPGVLHIGDGFTPSAIPATHGFIPPQPDAVVSEPTTLMLFVCALILLWAVYELKSRRQ